MVTAILGRAPRERAAGVTKIASAADARRQRCRIGPRALRSKRRRLTNGGHCTAQNTIPSSLQPCASIAACTAGSVV